MAADQRSYRNMVLNHDCLPLDFWEGDEFTTDGDLDFIHDEMYEIEEDRWLCDSMEREMQRRFDEANAEYEAMLREEEAKDNEPEQRHFAARPVSAMALSNKGGRHLTRGWRGSRFVKQQTNRAMRRLARLDPENAPTQLRVEGWVW